LDDFDELEIEAVRNKYGPALEGLTNEEKEELIIDMVCSGEISADEAVILVTSEGLDLDN
jgi:polyhydroxyalkanoate synthesis regulator phasin